MLDVLVPVLINLEALSMPLPGAYVPYSGGTGVTTTTQVPAYAPLFVPSQSTNAPTSTGQSATTPTSNVQETTSGATTTISVPTQVQIVAPKITNPLAPTPEEVLQELYETEGRPALSDSLRGIIGVPSVSAVGAFDRVLVAPVQGGSGTSTSRSTGGVPTSGFAAGGGVGGADVVALQKKCINGVLFTEPLRLGSIGGEIMLVQQFLNTSVATRLGETGAGSKGQETDTFAQKTFDAVKKFQTLYASDILTPLTLTEPTGEWRALSIKKANQLVCGR